MNSIVSTSALSKRYGSVMRVDDVDLKVPEGAVFGFLGPNGAGKTTTLKMILGLVKPTAGNVMLFGQMMNQRNRLPVLRAVGSLIESPSYYGHLTGEENLRIVQILKGVCEKQIDRVLHIVRLENQKKKKVGQYSLGMKQRLGLASALLGEPRLLILDEPTNGLDPAGIQEIRDLIKNLPQKFGVTVLVSSHLLAEIDQIATHVGIISQGRLVFQDSLEFLHQKSHKKIAIRTLDNQAARKILQQNLLPCEIQNDYLLLPHTEDDAVAQCVTLLSAGGAGVVRIEERVKSLEDIFLQLTGTAVSL